MDNQIEMNFVNLNSTVQEQQIVNGIVQKGFSIKQLNEKIQLLQKDFNLIPTELLQRDIQKKKEELAQQLKVFMDKLAVEREY